MDESEANPEVYFPFLPPTKSRSSNSACYCCNNSFCVVYNFCFKYYFNMRKEMKGVLINKTSTYTRLCIIYDDLKLIYE